MSKKFAVKHNLDQLQPEELRQYLREVSEFIELDPDLNGLDTIWLPNPNGVGRSLVPYARRGTCEVLRNIYEVEVEWLTYDIVEGSITFTATGRSKKRGNRQEIAIGSKYIGGLVGKDKDNAIMTASTRALNRLTMQFTTLGILAESEVIDMLGDVPNTAGSAQLATNPLPPIYAAPSVPANNAPGKLVETKPTPITSVNDPAATGEPFLGQPEQIAAAWEQVEAKKADKKADTPPPAAAVTPVESPVTQEPEAATKPAKTPRKSRAVQLDVEPETVSAKADNPQSQPTATSAPTQAAAAAPVQVDSVEKLLEPAAGMPTPEQMAEYRKRIGSYTEALTAGIGMGRTQKMRAFIAKMNGGTAPQNLSIVQWENTLKWFDARNASDGILGVVNYIEETLK